MEFGRASRRIAESQITAAVPFGDKITERDDRRVAVESTFLSILSLEGPAILQCSSVHGDAANVP